MRAFLSALLLSFVTLAPAALAVEAHAPCVGKVCDRINELCGGCIPAASAAERAPAPCTGEVCDAINAICGGCLDVAPQAAAEDCPGELCDVINVVCWVVFREQCVY